MTQFNIYTAQNAPAPSNKNLAALKQNFGFVPNVFAVLAEAPAALDAFISLNNLFAQTSLSPTEREIIQLTVSVENDCPYCVAGHTAFAKRFGVDDNAVVCVRDMDELEDPKLRTLQSFTRSMLNSRGHVSEEELQAFFAVGYTPRQYHEVTLGICVKVFSNLTSIGTGIPLDAQFVPYAWKKPHSNSANQRDPHKYPEDILDLAG